MGLNLAGSSQQRVSRSHCLFVAAATARRALPVTVGFPEQQIPHWVKRSSIMTKFTHRIEARIQDSIAIGNKLIPFLKEDVKEHFWLCMSAWCGEGIVTVIYHSATQGKPTRAARTVLRECFMSPGQPVICQDPIGLDLLTKSFKICKLFDIHLEKRTAHLPSESWEHHVPPPPRDSPAILVCLLCIEHSVDVGEVCLLFSFSFVHEIWLCVQGCNQALCFLHRTGCSVVLGPAPPLNEQKVGAFALAANIHGESVGVVV